MDFKELTSLWKKMTSFRFMAKTKLLVKTNLFPFAWRLSPGDEVPQLHLKFLEDVQPTTLFFEMH